MANPTFRSNDPVANLLREAGEIEQAASAMLGALRDMVRLGENSPRDKSGDRAFVDVRDLEAFLARSRAAMAAAERAGIKVPS